MRQHMSDQDKTKFLESMCAQLNKEKLGRFKIDHRGHTVVPRIVGPCEVLIRFISWGWGGDDVRFAIQLPGQKRGDRYIRADENATKKVVKILKDYLPQRQVFENQQAARRLASDKAKALAENVLKKDGRQDAEFDDWGIMELQVQGQRRVKLSMSPEDLVVLRHHFKIKPQFVHMFVHNLEIFLSQNATFCDGMGPG